MKRAPMTRAKTATACLLMAGLAAGLAAGGGLIASAADTPPPPPGYLPRGATPSVVGLLPAAPATGSATQARDDAASKAALKQWNTPRWTLATRDARLAFPAAADAYACALDVDIGPQTTPHLYTLLRRSLLDAGLSTYPAKIKYKRARPFTVNSRPICTPQDEAGLRSDGSYPSGHAAVGWTWALILAQAAPDRQDAVLARGRAFMQSRVVCNVHWRSDVEAGGVEGAAVFARLQNEPAFRDDLAAAAAEITAARAAGHHPANDCRAEAAALAMDSTEQP